MQILYLRSQKMRFCNKNTGIIGFIAFLCNQKPEIVRNLVTLPYSVLLIIDFQYGHGINLLHCLDTMNIL